MGYAVAFCLVRSQLIVEMVEQSLPVGQQIAEWLSLKGLQFVLEGQQKLEGNPGLLHAVKVVVLDVGHEFTSLSKRPIICAARTAAESAVAGGTVEEMRQTAVSLRKVERPMAICRMIEFGNDDRAVARLCSGSDETAGVPKRIKS